MPSAPSQVIPGIPDGISGTILGALITLAGVYFSNRGAMARLVRQLQHEAEERRRQREAELRQSIYLGAARAGFSGCGA